MEKKNIDRLFQEKFRDFEANPPEYMWDRIEEELNKKKKRRVIPIWWKLSGVAALFLIGLALWNLWRMDADANSQRVVTAPEGTAPVRIDSGSVAPPLTPAPGSLIEGVAGSEKEIEKKAGSFNQAAGEVQITEPYQKAVASEQKNTSNGVRNNAPGNRRNQSSPAIAGQDRNSVAGTTQSGNSEKLPKTAGQKQVGVANTAGAIASGDRNLKSPSGNAADNRSELQTEETVKNVNAQGQPDNRQQVAEVPGKKNISPDNQAGPERILSVQNPEKAIAVQDASVKKDSVVVAAAEPNALEELLIEKEEKEKKVTSDAKLNRWQITSNVAPIYFSSASNGSPIDSRLEETSKSYKTSVSYGAGVQYALNKRLSVRSGVNALALEYATTDIFFMQTPNATPLRNVRTNLQGSLIQVESDPGMVSMATSRGDKRYDGMLNQRIGYIEVPVEMSYQILQKRFGVALIGGFSTLFLNQNEVSIEGTGLNMTIGEANNLNPMHFSTNVGLGIKYDFLKSLQFKVEPIVKYQLNTFSNDSGNFRPFFLGIYTGLNYRF